MFRWAHDRHRVSKTTLSSSKWASSMQKDRSKFSPYPWGSQHYRPSNHYLCIVCIYVFLLSACAWTPKVGFEGHSSGSIHLVFGFFFSPFYVYMVTVLTYMLQVHMCGETGVFAGKAWSWHQESSPIPLPLCSLRRECQSNSEFAGTTNLASQLTQLWGSCLHLWKAGITGRQPGPSSICRDTYQNTFLLNLTTEQSP